MVALLLAHPPLALEEKVFGADLIVEVRLPQRTVERMVFPPGDEAPASLPAKLFVFPPGHACLAKLERGAKVLVFLKRDASGALSQLASVEQAQGPWTSLSPAYAQFVDAAARARTWHEERMRAVPDAMLWQDEKAALAQTENPLLALLAARFLKAHGAEAVLDAAVDARAQKLLAGPACP